MATGFFMTLRAFSLVFLLVTCSGALVQASPAIDRESNAENRISTNIGQRAFQRLKNISGKPYAWWTTLQQKRQGSTLGDLSTVSLLMGSEPSAAVLGGFVARLAGPLTGIGAVGLGIHSARNLVLADTREKRLDAVHGLAWSMQGLSVFGGIIQSKAAWIEPAAQGFGVLGGGIQMVVGGVRLLDGLKGDRRRLILGGLDVGSGLCWAASACSFATPFTLTGYVGFSSMRLAYVHRHQIKKVAIKIKEKVVRRWASR
jgi:hypothetical protein